MSWRERERVKISLSITDIPYGDVNRKSNGLRNLDKENADIETFSLDEFLPLIYEITDGTIIIFCGITQVSTIAKFFSEKQKTYFNKSESWCILYSYKIP